MVARGHEGNRHKVTRSMSVIGPEPQAGRVLMRGLAPWGAPFGSHAIMRVARTPVRRVPRSARIMRMVPPHPEGAASERIAEGALEKAGRGRRPSRGPCSIGRGDVAKSSACDGKNPSHAVSRIFRSISAASFTGSGHMSIMSLRRGHREHTAAGHRICALPVEPKLQASCPKPANSRSSPTLETTVQNTRSKH